MSATALAWPEKTITVIAPMPVGNSSDIVARIVSQELSDKLQVPVIVENKVGASTSIGTKYVIKSEPNGYTILFNSSGIVVTNRTLKSANYNINEDLIPITAISNIPFVLVTKSGLYTDHKDFIEKIKNKEKVSYAINGIGTPNYFLTEKFKTTYNIKGQFIPYKGTQEAITDVLSGEIDFFIASIPASIELIKNKQLDAFIIFTDERSKKLPNVPTIAELGHSEVSIDLWNGVFLPKDTPKEIVDKFSDVINEIKQSPKFKEKLENIGVDVYPPMKSTNFIKMINKDINFIDDIMRVLNIQPQ